MSRLVLKDFEQLLWIIKRTDLRKSSQDLWELRSGPSELADSVALSRKVQTAIGVLDDDTAVRIRDRSLEDNLHVNV